MMKSSFFFLGLLALLLIASSAGAADIYRGWELKQVDRQIMLQTQNVRTQLHLVAQNVGDKAVSTFHLAFPADTTSHVAHLVAYVDKQPLPVSRVENDNDADVDYFQVDLGREVAPQGQAIINVAMVLSHVQQPFPTHISQADKQLVVYTDTLYFFSPYDARTQKTVIKVPVPGSVESFTQEGVTPAPLHRADSISYGPFQDVKALQRTPLKVHYENNSPFLTITKLVREVEISHWGNVAVTEEVEMQHDGAKLQGPFSRFDYQRAMRGQFAPVIRSVVNVLPLHAADIYYRDEIGNISTSDISVVNDKLAVDLTPRFPLFGGWKTKYTFGYNLPLSHYVFTDASDASKLVLNITFGKELTIDPVIDELIVRVILPEGSKNPEFRTPFSLDKEENAIHKTYLDTAGRPVIIAHKRNVVPEHNKYFQVSYNFSKSSMFLEPFLLVGTYFVVFVLAMIYVRFELSITKEKVLDPKEAKQAKILDLLNRIKDIHEERSELQQHAAKKVFSGKGAAVAVQEKKKAETAFNASAKEIQRIEAELDELHLGLATKLKQLERKEKEKQSLLDDLVQNEVTNQDKKGSAYETKKAQLQKALAKAEEEAEDLVYELTEEF